MIKRAFFATALAGLTSGTAGWATPIDLYEFTVIENVPFLSSNIRGPAAIAEDGTVVTTGNTAGGFISRTPQDDSGADVALINDFDFSNYSINEVGQTAAIISDGAARDLVIIEPDGTRRTILSANGFNQTEGEPGSFAGFSGVELADNGDLAVVIGVVRQVGENSSNAVTETVLFHVGDTESDTPTLTELETDIPGLGGINLLQGNIGIDPSGRVAWVVDKAPLDAAEDGSELRLYDPATDTTTTVLEIAGGGTLIRGVPSLNGNGDFAVELGSNVTVDGEVIPGVTPLVTGPVDDARAETLTVKTQGTGSGSASDINNFGQTARLGIQGGPSITVDGDVIVSRGQVIDGVTVGTGNGTLIANHGEFLNDAGQFVFNFLGVDESTGESRVVTVRADPVGSTVETAVLPTTQEGPVAILDYTLTNALGVTRPIFVDPVVMTEFDYSLLDGPLITSLLIPFQDLGDGEDGLFDVIFGDQRVELGWDETLDFTIFDGFQNGLSAFTIAGIQGSDVRTDDPFVVGLTHAVSGNSNNAVQLQITGRDVTNSTLPAVPLPASAWLLLVGLGAFRLLKFRARN